MSDLDPDRTLHDAPCLACGARLTVPLSRTRLERRPWRFVWWCEACGDLAQFPAPPDLIGPMRRLDRAGGAAISVREVRRFEGASAAEWEDAVREELLP